MMTLDMNDTACIFTFTGNMGSSPVPWLGQNAYQFVLPFPLSSAPRVFTKNVVPFLPTFGHMGLRFTPVLDECLIKASSQEEFHRSFSASSSVFEQPEHISKPVKVQTNTSIHQNFLGEARHQSRQAVSAPGKSTDESFFCPVVPEDPSDRNDVPEGIDFRVIFCFDCSIDQGLHDKDVMVHQNFWEQKSHPLIKFTSHP